MLHPQIQLLQQDALGVLSVSGNLVGGNDYNVTTPFTRTSIRQLILMQLTWDR